MTVPEARNDPRLRRWPLRRRRISTARGPLSFVVPTSSDAVLASLGDDADSEDLPYWADVWASSLVLARILARTVGDLTGWRAIDLGCGVGVAGVGAGVLGASVWFLDSWDVAVHFSRFNAKANAIPADRIHGSRFDWNRDRLPLRLDGEATTSDGRQGRTHRSVSADVADPEITDIGGPSRTVLLMADLFYEPRHHGPLDRFVDEVLEGGGAVFAADPRRDAADPWFERFVARHGARVDLFDTHDGRRRVDVRLGRAGAALPGRARPPRQSDGG